MVRQLRQFPAVCVWHSCWCELHDNGAGWMQLGLVRNPPSRRLCSHSRCFDDRGVQSFFIANSAFSASTVNAAYPPYCARLAISGVAGALFASYAFLTSALLCLLSRSLHGQLRLASTDSRREPVGANQFAANRDDQLGDNARLHCRLRRGERRPHSLSQFM